MARHLHAASVTFEHRWDCPRTRCETRVVGRDEAELARRRVGHLLGHDLADLAGYYPLLEDLLDHTRAPARGSRSSSGGGGLGVPVNLSVLEFVDDIYLDGDGAPAPGVKHTVVMCERACARALGLGYTPRRRHETYCGVGVDDRILEALSWVRSMAGRLAYRHEQVADSLRAELHRLNSRAEHMLYGARFSSTWSRCPACDAPGPGGLGTVVAGVMATGRMAVCLNYPTCEGEAGGRRCWRYDPDVEEWLAVPEPAGATLDADASRFLTVTAQTSSRAAQ